MLKVSPFNFTVPLPFERNEYVVAGIATSVGVTPPACISILPGAGVGPTLPAVMLPNPFEVKSPTTDSSVAVLETPEKLNEYVPDRFALPAPKTEGSCRIISPAAVVVPAGGVSIISAWLGETTTMLK